MACCLGTVGLLYATGRADERVAKYREEVGGAGDQRVPAYKVRGFNAVEIEGPTRFNRKDNKDELIRELRRERTFVVYTTAEVDKLVATAAEKAETDAKKSAQAKLAEAKADLLKAISEAVGRQLSSEQLEQVKALIARDLKEEIKRELADSIAEAVRSEVARSNRGR